MQFRPARAPRLLPRLVAALMIGTALAGAPAAFAPAQAQTVAVENLTFGPKEMSVAIPKIEVDGSTLTQGELATLFQFKDIKSIADTLGRFNARSMRIPEIRVEQNIAAGGKTTKQTIVYRDLTFNDVQGGKAKTVALAGGSMAMEDAVLGKSTGTVGRMSMEDMDFTGMVRFMIDKAVGGEAPKTLYRNGSFDGMSMKGDKFEFSLGKMTFGEFRARPMKTPMIEFLALAQDMEKNKGQPPDPATMKRLIDFMMDLLDAFESTPATMENMKIAAPDDKGRQVNIAMGKLTMGGFGKRRYPSILVENMEIKAADGFVNLGTFNFKGIDFGPTFAGLQEAGTAPLEQWAQANWRKLIPSFDGVAFGNVNIDVPDDKNKGQRIKAKLGNYDLTLASYVQGIPTNISTQMRNFVFEIPANTKDDGLLQIVALGYKAIDASAGLQAKWNEQTKTISIDNLSAQGAGMGAVNVKGTIGNAIKELFTGDPTMMQVAALGLTAKDLEIKVDNAGLLEKLIAREAQKQGKKPDDFRRDMGAMANVIIPGMMGGGEAAQTVANAVSAFLAKPGSLLLAAKAKDPAGISIGEAAMASNNPLSLLPKLAISAKAN
ncbi:hypothetical protein [Terrarubrum flagellatum]|uniref:hypothetical protein n=1 Tax=Terrirubrum flagellatum TaxID=2895980 RepID=UPI0031452B0C